MWRSSTRDWCSWLSDAVCPCLTERLPWDQWVCQVIYEASFATLTSLRSQQHRSGARESESWKSCNIKLLRNPHVCLCQFVYVIGLRLQQNQTPAGHIMTDCISELITHCRDIWMQTAHTDSQTQTAAVHTRMVYNHPCTDTHAHTPCHPVMVWVMDQSRLILSWILHGISQKRRIPTERCRNTFRLLESSVLFLLSVMLLLIVAGDLCCWVSQESASSVSGVQQRPRLTAKQEHNLSGTNKHWIDKLLTRWRLFMLHCWTKGVHSSMKAWDVSFADMITGGWNMQK